MAKDKYEISLWKDEEVPADGNIPAHYEEKKIAIIGSDTMTAPCRALEPKLVENVNGTNTFTFKMLYLFNISDIEEARARNTIADDLTWIIDDEQHDKYRNPFTNLLVNERKVKALWKGKWYDLVIKNIQEDSNGRSAVYTCKDLFINELSKTGFELTFDNELENNQGNAQELATKTLDKTDWKFVGLNGKVLKLDENGTVVETLEEGPESFASDTIQQEKEEPVYEVILDANFNSVKNQNTGATTNIPLGQTILVFYQQIQDYINEGTQPKPFQFAYTENYQRDTNSQLVINADCYSHTSVTFTTTSTIIDQVTYEYVTIKNGDTIVGKILKNSEVSQEYRASRFVESQVCKLDPLTGQYCYVYTASTNRKGSYNLNDEIYMYRSTKYKDATFVNNLVVNSSGFTSTDGWTTANSANTPRVTLYPEYDGTIDWTPTMYLRLIKGVYYTNYGIRQSSNFIPNGFKKGEKYIFRFKARYETGSGNNVYPGDYNSEMELRPQIVDKNNVKYFNVSALRDRNYNNGKWLEYDLTCIKSVTRAQIYSNEVILKVAPPSTLNNNIYLEDIELFPKVIGANGNRINPGEYDIESVAQVYYSYYNHTQSESLTNSEDIEYLYEDTTEWNMITQNNPEVVPVYNNNFEKIRSISAKQSNRFNILQSIAETFECWIKFFIDHDPDTGKTVYNDDGTPRKYVTIKKDIGQETGIGFIYGIDLKTISRSIKSDQIVTKTIVTQNSNEFAQNGFCTIARSEENYPRTNFILNFDYYISQNLMPSGQLNKDLYVTPVRLSSEISGEWVLEDEDIYDRRYKDSVDGYYFFLNKWNKEYDSNIEWISNKRTELEKQKSYLTVYQDTLIALNQQKTNLESELINIAGAKSWAGAKSYLEQNKDKIEVKSRQTALSSVGTQITLYGGKNNKGGYIGSITKSITNLEKALTAKETRQETLLSYIKDKHFAFYKKYSRFIQEGTWISEEYIDDNLYYLDAQSVAYTSSRPQVEYNISVLRLSSLEEFKNKVFYLGDIAYIQDAEFFGYIFINDIKTPYKEKVLVSEITSNFDEPEKDSFKVQNYKTQFEDLFQRITSTTQSLQYASGGYARAASIVETDGNIKPETLQSSIAINEQLVISAKNETVFSDSTGLTVASMTNSNNRVKITSGGVFITTDGGETWKSAIRGGGVATESLSAGAISANLINILDGEHTAFRWNSQGINAFNQQQFGEFTSINTSKFVRFDHYGIYGINGFADFNPDITTDGKIGEEKIWNSANFGMTWHGFFLKNSDDTGYIEISNDNDIRVIGKVFVNDNAIETERVKIGRLYNGVVGYEQATEAEPLEGVTYYIQNGPWYDIANLTLFKDSETYVLLEYDTASLFRKEDLFVHNNNLSGFIEGIDYYEMKEDGTLEITEDITPQGNKTYYWTEGFDDNKNYYIPAGNSYVQIDTINISPTYGVDYYCFEKDPNETYYVKSDEDGHFTVEDPTEVTALTNIFYVINVVDVDKTLQPVDFLTYYIEQENSYVPATDNDFVRGFLTGQDAPTYYKKASSVAYGIRISDASGAAVMETSSNGTLWLRKALYIQSTNNPNDEQSLYNIALGFLGEEYPSINQNISATNYQLWPNEQQKDNNVQYYSYDSETHQYIPNDNGNYYLQITQEMREKGLYKKDANNEEAEPQPTTNTDIMGLKGFTYFYFANLHQIFNTNNNFIVYEDGSIIANNGTFTGEINATSGTFTGELIAATGQFTGEIVADSGWFGKPNKGVEITENGLLAINGSSIIVDGGNFEIYDSKYDLYVPRPDEFDVNTEYWYQDEEGDWTLEDSSEPVEGRDYYSRTRNNKVFYFNQEKNILSVIGRIEATEGYFSGELRAANGTFTGELVAPSGTIGGFIISQNQLVSIATNSQDEPLIKLNGTDGSIEAENIILGTGAEIREYLYLGDFVRLYNAGTNIENKFLVVIDEQGNEKIVFKQDSTIQLGNIYLDGNESVIFGGESPNQGYFKITPNQANFTNIVASGKISTVVFEQDHTQAVGGSMVFKPSFKIEQVTNEIINNENFYRLFLDNNIEEYIPYSETEYYIDIIDTSGKRKTSNPILAKNPINGIVIAGIGGIDNFKFNYSEVGVLSSFTEGVNYYYLDNGLYIYENQSVPQAGRIYWIEDQIYYLDNIGLNVVDQTQYPNPVLDVTYYTARDGGKSSNELLISQSEIFNISDASFIIILGHLGDLIVGINTNNTESSYLRARGITITEFNKQNSKYIPYDPQPLSFNEDKQYFELINDEYVLIETQDQTPNSGKIYYEFIEEKFIDSIKAFLGDLDATGLFPNSGHGFGLYTQNAYLTGSLTTQLNSGKYAGVNTLNGVGATIFNPMAKSPDPITSEDQSSIVFWAGSEDETIEAIQKAPFQVTEWGSLYAAQGKFEGAIITKSEIRGTDIYAARIHGTGQRENIDFNYGENDKSNYGLAFYNMDEGIVFKTDGDYDINYKPYKEQPSSSFDSSKEYWYRENGVWIQVDLTITPLPTPQEGVEYCQRIIAKDVFWIGQQGLGLKNNQNTNYFISIENQEVSFLGKIFKANNMILDSNSLQKNNLYFKINETNFSFEQQNTSSFNIDFENNIINNLLDIVFIKNTLKLNEKLEYRQVDNGYDLYVS